MENQHKKIKGYRELSQEEINLMNRIKEKGEELGTIVSELKDIRIIDNQLEPVKLMESHDAIAIAEPHLKTGVMWLVRAVALPDSF